MSKLISGDLVSVIIPFCNDSQNVKETLESVYNQTYQNIELILLSDRDTDSNLEIVQQWLAKEKVFDRFSKIILENKEIYFNFHDYINSGFSLAQGNALTVLNPGDAYTPKRIELLLLAAENYHADWLLSGIRVINETGTRVSSDSAVEIEALVDLCTNFPAISFAFLKKNIAATFGNLLFSRELYDKVGAFCNFKYHHAWDFALQACLISEPVLINEPLYLYRLLNSQSFSEAKIEQALEQKIIYRRYFSACRAGKCINPNAPWLSNWPRLFENWITNDPILYENFNLVGQEFVKYNLLANTIGLNVN